jgi:hypothetical protein
MAPKRETKLEAPQPRNIQRSDVALEQGFALVVDGCLKTTYEDEAGGQESRGRPARQVS